MEHTNKYELIPVWNNEENEHLWTIMCLKKENYFMEKGEPAIYDNTELWLFGYNKVIKNWQDVMESMYRNLYDEYQVNEYLKEGDIIWSKTRLYKDRWDNEKTIRVPAMCFVCEGVHVLCKSNGNKFFEEFFKDKVTMRY